VAQARQRVAAQLGDVDQQDVGGGAVPSVPQAWMPPGLRM